MFKDHLLSERVQKLFSSEPKKKGWFGMKWEEFWKMESPRAATAKEWKIWRKMARKKYPIRYYIKHILPYKTYLPVQWRIRDAYWWVMHRIHPKHRYHVIKPKTLQPGYCDERELLLHASFGILCDFVERELDQDTCIVNWEADEHHLNAWKEMNAIRDWWIKYQTKEDTLPDYPSKPKTDGDDEEGYLDILDREEGTDFDIECKRVSNEIFSTEDRWETEAEEMLIRLAKIRVYLWT